MHKTIRIDFFLSFFLASVIFSYIFFHVQGISFLSTLVRYGFILIVIFIFMLVIFRDQYINKKVLLFSPAIAFSIVFFIQSIEKMNSTTIINVATQLGFFMLVYVVATIKWKRYQLKIFSALSIIVFIPTLILLIILVQSGYFELNPNTLGAYAFFLAFFPLLYYAETNKKLTSFQTMALISISIITVYFSSARSIYLCLAIAGVTFFCWKQISSNKILFNFYFLLIASIIFFVTILYPKMYLWNNFHKIESLSLEYTGKSLMTGRGPLWENVSDVISLKPFFGHGTSARLSDFIHTGLSPHNLYLSVGMQVGVVGLTLLIFFLYLTWKSLWNGRNDKRAILSACFFIAILFHQTFEVSLVQANFGIGLLQWLIIGFALNFSINNKTALK